MRISRHTLAAALLFWTPILVIMLAMITAGCTTIPKEKAIEAPKVVSTPITKACVPKDLPGAPGSYPDDALTAASPPEDRFRLNASANQARKARLAQIEPVIAGCR